jgi:hypothetical protein
MSLLPPRKPKVEETDTAMPEKHLHVESENDPHEDALSRADKLTAILEQLTLQSANAGLSAPQLEAILTKVGLSTAEGMRMSLKPENTEHRNESAFFTARDKAKYGSWQNKPTLTRKTFFVGAEEKDERLMPEEIEGYNAITKYCEARNGKWKAQIKKNGQAEELWIDVPCETVDNRMDLPSLILILHELNGGRSTADVHSLIKQIEILKRDAISRGASAGELEALLMADG